jgi:hypothetical protein
MKALSLTIQKIWLMLKGFFKVGQTSRLRSEGPKFWYQEKGLVIRNTHMKYESPIKIWPMLKFLHKDKQTDRPKTICPPLSIRGHKNVIVSPPH